MTEETNSELQVALQRDSREERLPMWVRHRLGVLRGEVRNLEKLLGSAETLIEWFKKEKQ